jgi:magnesium-dependent phosphatase 1
MSEAKNAEEEEVEVEIVPKVAVFDLDDTLWAPEMWLLSGSPFRKDQATGRVYDQAGEHVYLFDEAKEVLAMLYEKHKDDVQIAYASRTEYPDWARSCLKLIEVIRQGDTIVTMRDVMSTAEIYPGNKISHFKKIQKTTGIPFEDMAFFDNEYRNIADVSKLGVTCVYTPDGMDWESWNKAVKQYRITKGIDEPESEPERQVSKKKK